MSSFDLAHSFTSRWELGLTERPVAPGEITSNGVTLRWLQQLDAREGDSDEMIEFTRAQASRLMRRHFWEPLRCDEMPAPLAVVTYDAAVHTGTAQATKILQRCCNTVGEAHLHSFTPLAEYGRCGQLTLAMASDLEKAGLDFYAARMCVRVRMETYGRIIKQRPILEPFSAEWQARCAALLELLGNMEKSL